jgi:hypothetical protein
MPSSNQKSISYKRNKREVEITGHPNDVKWLMWFDLISSRLLWIMLILVLLLTLPKASILPVIIKWVERNY